jgi:general secretion pathway protein L
MALDQPIAAYTLAFWRWWTGELRALLPQNLRRAGLNRQRTLVLLPGREIFEVALQQGGRTRHLGHCPLPGADAVVTGAMLRDLLHHHNGRYDRVTLRIPAECGLHRSLRLPYADRARAEGVLAHDLDRLTPFSEDEIYYAIREARADRIHDRVDLELILARQCDVAPGMAAAAVAGLEVDCVEIAGQPDVNLLPAHIRPGRGAGVRRATVSFAAASIVLASALVYWPLYQLNLHLNDVDKALASAQRMSAEVNDLNGVLEALDARRESVLQRRQSSRYATEILSAVTEALPNHSFLLDYTYSGDAIDLLGYAGETAELIGRLEAVEALQNVRFAAPVTVDTPIGRERYRLAAEVIPKDTGG